MQGVREQFAEDNKNIVDERNNIDEKNAISEKGIEYANNTICDNDRVSSKGKSPSMSQIEMTQLVLPNDTNVLGNLLGGRLMHWIDIAGAMAASRHSNKVVATVALDSLDFRHPVRMGEFVILKAKLTWVGRTSMEVTVSVFAENYETGSVIQTNKAYITYVALDHDGNPTPVPSLLPETEEEKKDYMEAEQRRNERLDRRKKETGC
jgi:acyl-CoA hydrolase